VRCQIGMGIILLSSIGDVLIWRRFDDCSRLFIGQFSSCMNHLIPSSFIPRRIIHDYVALSYNSVLVPIVNQDGGVFMFVPFCSWPNSLCYSFSSSFTAAYNTSKVCLPYHSLLLCIHALICVIINRGRLS
jgi:hypothetical protein